MNMFARFDENPAMTKILRKQNVTDGCTQAWTDNVKTAYRELTPSPYFFVLSICLAYMNMFARFDENPAKTLQDIKETKRYGRMHASMDGQCENSIPTTNKV